MTTADDLFALIKRAPGDDVMRASINAILAKDRAEMLREVYAAIEDPAQRRAVGGGLGWETARDVVHNMIHKAEGTR